ncbi:MAG: YlxR family protein [Polyangiaceae bacterium]
MAKNETNESNSKHVRTCIGCGSKDDPGAFVRLVLGTAADGGAEILVDVGSKAVGRGAHVHATWKCLQSACKSGLSKSFHQEIHVKAKDVAADITAALDRRIEGLVVAARGAGALAVGADKAIAAMHKGAPLVVVARDAGSVGQKEEVLEAAGSGRAIVWRDKTEIGRVVDRTDVAMIAIENAGIASAVREAANAIASLDVQNFAEVGAKAAAGSEVR